MVIIRVSFGHKDLSMIDRILLGAIYLFNELRITRCSTIKIFLYLLYIVFLALSMLCSLLLLTQIFSLLTNNMISQLKSKSSGLNYILTFSNDLGLQIQQILCKANKLQSVKISI